MSRLRHTCAPPDARAPVGLPTFTAHAGRRRSVGRPRKNAPRTYSIIDRRRRRGAGHLTSTSRTSVVAAESRRVKAFRRTHNRVPRRPRFIVAVIPHTGRSPRRRPAMAVQPARVAWTAVASPCKVFRWVVVADASSTASADRRPSFIRSALRTRSRPPPPPPPPRADGYRSARWSRCPRPRCRNSCRDRRPRPVVPVVSGHPVSRPISFSAPATKNRQW